MADLTPEEKQRIYLEEKARIETQEQIRAEMEHSRTETAAAKRIARLHGGGYDWLDSPPQQPSQPARNMKPVFGAFFGILMICMVSIGYSALHGGFADDTPSISSTDATNATSPSPDTSPAVSAPQTLQQDYDAVQMGASRTDVIALVGRDPDLTYTGSNGGPVLQWKDGNVNVFRVMLTGDQVVVGATYVPIAGGLDAAQIKGTTL